VKVLPYGASAVLVEPEDPAAVLALSAEVRNDPDVLEVVPGARTLLVRAAPGAIAAVGDRIRTLAARPTPPPGAGTEAIVLDVDYDGPDLADTAALLGLAADELVRRHAGGAYVVAFCGFAPGFAYLTGLPAELHVPRLAEPRTRVPSGAVGIAGEFTGVYPRPSPGGWRLLGRTDAVLWDLERTPPALLTPGTRVRFRAR
jgi:KipI family sensor histidine kinase inhibitor